MSVGLVTGHCAGQPVHRLACQFHHERELNCSETEKLLLRPTEGKGLFVSLFCCPKVAQNLTAAATLSVFCSPWGMYEVRALYSHFLILPERAFPQNAGWELGHFLTPEQSQEHNNIQSCVNGIGCLTRV